MKKNKQNTGLTHFDAAGAAHMVDVSAKPDTLRIAIAEGEIRMKSSTFNLLSKGTAKKGDVLGVARIAAIQAVKKTADLIPLAHPIDITRIHVAFEKIANRSAVRARVQAETLGKTGVEMEALTGVSVALLTIYDMCKAVDRGMTIHGIQLLEKSGGQSGHFIRRDR